MLDDAPTNLKDGSNFSLRFLWAVGHLGAIGLIHSLFFPGQILTIMLSLGVLLPAFVRLSNAALIISTGLLFVGVFPASHYALTAGTPVFSTGSRQS